MRESWFCRRCGEAMEAITNGRETFLACSCGAEHHLARPSVSARRVSDEEYHRAVTAAHQHRLARGVRL
ncbi:MAG: hypothetical protein AB7R55_14725 [Gemmatimonadales bacterium]